MIVWKIKWNTSLTSFGGVRELLDETYTDDISNMFFKDIFFTTREKAEKYVEKVSKNIASAILIDQINESNENEKSKWESRSYEKVRWDEASQEKLDQHEKVKMTSTTYWVAPKHSFDHYGVFIAQVDEIEVR